MTTTESWKVKDLGPIDLIEFPRPLRGGLMLFLGRNGSGKSVALDAIRAAEGDDTARKRIGPSDGARKGVVDLGSVQMTIGKQARRSGDGSSLACLELSSSIDPSRFVDPGIKDPVAADAARMRELCAMAGLETFSAQWVGLLGEDTANNYDEEGLFDGGPVTAAASIKKALQRDARQAEDAATQARGRIEEVTVSLREMEAAEDDAGRNEAMVEARSLCSQWSEAVDRLSQELASAKVALAEAQAKRDELLRAEAEAQRRVGRIEEKRQALSDHESSLATFTKSASTLRKTAAGVDGVLREIIESAGIDRISVDGERLVYDHPRRGTRVPIAELSEGERYRIALELVARRLGEGAVVAVEQSAAESLDPENLAEIDAIAEELGVTIFSARASSGDLRVVRFNLEDGR